MFVLNEDCEAKICGEGVSRKVMAWSDELMLCEITFEAGGEGALHSHPHQQISYVAEGEFEFTVDGDTQRVCKGDSIYIPSQAVHGLKCVKAGVILDIFNPKREDFLTNS